MTRALLKRQVRTALRRHAGKLGSGWWVVRLRAPFEPRRFASAASPALRGTVALELDALFAALA